MKQGRPERGIIRRLYAERKWLFSSIGVLLIVSAIGLLRYSMSEERVEIGNMKAGRV